MENTQEIKVNYRKNNHVLLLLLLLEVLLFHLFLWVVIGMVWE